MESKAVYLEIIDRNPTEREENFLKKLEGLDLDKERLCISWDFCDLLMTYWITCERDWLEKNFPELLNDIVEKEPEHLDWKPENYGYYFITELL